MGLGRRGGGARRAAGAVVVVLMKRAAAYLRVSTDGQSCDNQLGDLRRMAKARELRIVSVYRETASSVGARPVFAEMRQDASRSAFDVLLVWSLDRFGRTMVGNVRDVLELEASGCRVRSYRDTFMDSSDATRPLLIAVLSWVAQQERERLVERTHAGLARARREGKRLGRPRRMDERMISQALALQARGRTLRQIAVALKVPRATLARECKGAR